MLRLAASSYLNTAPLIWSFQHGAQKPCVRLITDRAPARSADALASGEVDVALVPAIEYQNIADALIIPRVCIASHKQVRSVVLVTNGKQLNEVASVALDASSRTSAALVQIIFREFLNRQPLYVPAAPDIETMLEANDAALIIGDPAMTVKRFNKDNSARRVYDLAETWRAMTGHGFVFALWMTRDGLGAKRLQRICEVDFALARDEGLRRASEIITAYETNIDLPRHQLERYLRENICYELDADLIAGLKLFHTLAYRHKLAHKLKELRFLE